MRVPTQPLRSRALRVVQWGTALLALWNLGRGIALWTQAELLADLQLSPGLGVRMVIAFIMSAAMIILAAGIYRRYSWSRVLVPILLTAYGVYELGLMILFSNEPPALLPVLAYGAFIGFSAWALWRPSTRELFHSKYKEGVQPDTP